MIHNQPEQQASELEKKQFISISKSAGHDKERLSKLNKPTNKPTNKQINQQTKANKPPHNHNSQMWKTI